jgi:hypothetical protein
MAIQNNSASPPFVATLLAKGEETRQIVRGKLLGNQITVGLMVL